MSIPLYKVTYEYLEGISCTLADFLDTLTGDATPGRLHIEASKPDSPALKRLRVFAKKDNDDAQQVKTLLERLKEEGSLDIAWG